MYNDIFTIIENDLFDNLDKIPEINDRNYQVIFTGHSLGGAIATISSFYYIKKYKFEAENILITFGQPKVGNELFAKELTNNLRQIYRIARPRDIATLFPFTELDLFFQYLKLAKFLINLSLFLLNFMTGNIFGASFAFFNLFSGDFFYESIYNIYSGASSEELLYYSHTGGLYMVDDDNSKVFHCEDFFNEKRNHFLCKNHKMKLTSSLINDFNWYRKYLTLDQDMRIRCQYRIMDNFILAQPLRKKDSSYRRLEISNYIKNKYNNKYYSNIIQRIRKLDNIQDIQENLILFEEKNFKKNRSEFCYKYESKEKLKIDDLILILNPKNKYFFGEICLSQNITWIINNEFDLINCYFINYKNPFAIIINLKKKIIDEKELFIYIKGKVSGILELYDLTKNKTLNLSTAYYIPYINDFPSGHSINFILPKLVENIQINIKVNVYGFNKNNTTSSIFEIYNNNNKINYERNNLILEKDNEYYFKYYPNQYELIINFIDIYSNKFLEKQFYIIGEQNISINYNIKSKSNNQSFGLFFDFNEAMNIKGYYSNYINNMTENESNFDDNILNTNDKYFNLANINDFNYLNLYINLYSQLASELIIYEIEEVIIINKINSIYEIKKKIIFFY